MLYIGFPPQTTKMLQEAIKTDGKLMTAVRLMCYEGLMLRVASGASLRSDSLLYVATEAWLAHRLDGDDPVQALNWLASVGVSSYAASGHSVTRCKYIAINLLILYTMKAM